MRAAAFSTLVARFQQKMDETMSALRKGRHMNITIDSLLEVECAETGALMIEYCAKDDA